MLILRAAIAGVLPPLLLLLHRGYRVQVKDGVVLALAPAMSRALPLIDRISVAAIGRPAIITSGTEGRHMVGSLHYVGRAVDLRTRDLSSSEIFAYAAALRAGLNWDRHLFDVLIESDHIHVEHDPR